MRNQQVKKVNRIFFAGQSEEKINWLEQMASEGWQLIGENSFVYTFQRVVTETIKSQSVYGAVLSRDFQKSMPLLQDSRPNPGVFLSEQNNSTQPAWPALDKLKLMVTTKKRRHVFVISTLILFLMVSMIKITMITNGDILSLLKLQFVTGMLLAGFSLFTGAYLLLKAFIKIFSPECKLK